MINNLFKEKKFIVILMCINIILTIMINGLFLSLHSDHHCVDKDCYICYQLHQAKENIRRFNFKILSLIMFFFTCLLFIFYIIYFHIHFSVKNSLIKLKVRLDN